MVVMIMKLTTSMTLIINLIMIIMIIMMTTNYKTERFS